MKTLTKISGVWKQARKLFVKQAGAWKPVKKAFVKISGAWEQVYQVYTEFSAPTVMWEPGSGGADAARVEVPAGVDVPDNGGFIFRLHMGINYDGITGESVESWTYTLLYRSGVNPTWNGSLRVTNVNTGVSLVLDKLTSVQWNVTVMNPVPSNPSYPDPNINWIRPQPAADTYRIERV